MDAGRFHLTLAGTPDVTVSLERTGPCNLHAGIVYLDSSGMLNKLHFAWHLYLMNHRYAGEACAEPFLDFADAMWIATFCGKVAWNVANYRTIPYNLKYDEDVDFDPNTGAVRFGPESTGLNCATFVLAVFRSVSNPLVTMVGWPPASAQDRSIQTGFINRLLDDPNDRSAAAQARRVNAEVGTCRVAPQHVAGSCLEDIYPVPFAPCDANGAFIVGRIDWNATPTA